MIILCVLIVICQEGRSNSEDKVEDRRRKGKEKDLSEVLVGQKGWERESGCVQYFPQMANVV